MPPAIKVYDAQFLKSATRQSEWPEATYPEVAICGRSNVGKSSLLNTMLGRRSLARVSRTPGRTRLLNFFSIDAMVFGAAKKHFYVADLPGFGYAEVSKGERQRWKQMMEEYLSTRPNLRAVVMLFDSRRALDKRADEMLFDETELVTYLAGLGRAVIPVVTKADKLSKNERKPAAMALGRLIGRPALLSSAETGDGLDDLWRAVAKALFPIGGETVAAADDSNDDPRDAHEDHPF